MIKSTFQHIVICVKIYLQFKTVNEEGERMFLALRELTQAKLRYFLVCAIMVAILFLVFFITGLAKGLSHADSSSLQSLKADYIVMNKEEDGVLVKSELTPKEVKQIQKEVDAHATPIKMYMSSIQQQNKNDLDIMYFAVDTKEYGNLKIIEGKQIHDLKTNEVIVDQSMKQQGYKLNDTLEDKNSKKEYKIAGFTKDNTYSFAPIIFISNKNLNRPQQIYNAVLYSGKKVDVDHFATFSREETVKAMPGYKETQGSFTMMKVFLFIIAAFVSSVFFYILTIQKSHQFGVLKAIGAKSWYIAKGILIQVAILTVLGWGIGTLGIYGIKSILPNTMPFVLPFKLILATGVVFLSLNIIGSMLSVFKVIKADALEAIGRVE